MSRSISDATNRRAAVFQRQPTGFCARARQKGQALVLAIVALLVLCVGVIVVFNTGQAVSRKVELINAADAAAYSAAVQQARAYNLIAYMNRAEVANEVAVAQMTSWYSWMNFTLRGTDAFKDAVQTVAVIFDISVVGAEVGVALQEAVTVLKEVQTVVTTLRDGMQTAFSAGVSAISAINDAYSIASQAVAQIESQEALKLVPEVVKRNTDGKAKIGARGYTLLEQGALEARSFVTRYTIPTSGAHSKGADRFANVVMEARDGFSRERNGGVWVVHKRGGTDLVDYTNWVGVDTLNVKFLLLDEPLAWGGAAAVNSSLHSFKSVATPGFNQGNGWDSPYDIDHGHYQRYAGGIDNHKASKKVLKSPAMGGNQKAWLKNYTGLGSPGLQPYNDIDEGKGIVPYDTGADNFGDNLQVGPVFTVLVEQPMSTVRTSDQIDGIGGPAGSDLEVPDQTIADSMTALSSAQVYFNRPRGFGLFDNVVSPSKRELGNLFSPYWQARLIDTPCRSRQEVAVSYGTVAPCI